jgi:hypothetical protein
MILKTDVGQERIGEVMRSIDLALAQEKTVEQMFWQIWMPPDRQSAVHYYDDAVTKVRNLSIRGKRKRSLTKLLAKR